MARRYEYCGVVRSQSQKHLERKEGVGQKLNVLFPRRASFGRLLVRTAREGTSLIIIMVAEKRPTDTAFICNCHCRISQICPLKQIRFTMDSCSSFSGALNCLWHSRTRVYSPNPFILYLIKLLFFPRFFPKE